MKQIGKEPLAIVGIGCRFPGGITSANTFWETINNRTDAIIDVPKERWDYRKFFDAQDKRPGKTRVKQGGYLHQSLDQFDPLFFGISPREAAYTDPQQRLLLEVTWEAFEDAGLTEQKLQGSNTGVFIGAFNLDNLLLQLGRDNLESISSSTAASVTMTMLSNRLSFAFDLKGPSVTMDTACSSSMVATHYASQSIWNGDCEMAIAGGVNVISRPEYMVSMSKGGFLSPHGRCKSFDEDAQGYVRGEGAGIIVIKTLKQALADKDQIYALIRNTGVNQDGYTQNGISFPSADAQRLLIEKVYRESNTNPLDVGYVEAHGTGTQAGDPIEISSLAAVFAKDRAIDAPCYVGSVKSNIGHTESAAGIAGLIKASLSVNKGAILPNLHFNKPNPKIDFAGGRIAVPTKGMVWEAKGKPRIASVNSFGYGGTNGHVILQQYLAETPAQLLTTNASQPATYLIPLSAKNNNALKAQCTQLRSFLTQDSGISASLKDINYSLAYRRSTLPERMCFAVKNKQELEEKLTAVINGDFPEAVVQQTVDAENTQRLVFVFTGMGPQWWGMGRELYTDEPVFQQKVDECDAIFQKISGWSIKAELLAPEAESQMARTSIAQPANFVIQTGLLALYESWGIKPAAVVGHSVGEVASAYASGALTLTDALVVSYQRSRLQQTCAGRGAMLAIGIGGDDAFDLASLYDQVSVAAVNSLSSVTLAGSQEQLEEIAQLLDAQGVFNRLLQVEVAYHSYQMDPIEAELREVLANIKPRAATLPLYSTAIGQAMNGEAFTADYWWKNVRQPVSFEKAIKNIIDDGYTHFLEVGPHPVTRNFLSECLADKKMQGRVIASLIRKKDENLAIMESLGHLFNAGYQLQWPEFIQQGQFIRLPGYPWQRDRYWNESQLSHNYLSGSGEQHPYFYEKLMTPEPAWQVEINENYFPFLNDHQISKRVVFPGAGYIEAGLALQHYQKGFTGIFSLENLKFHRMLMVDADKAQQLRIVEDKTNSNFAVYASEVNSGNWSLHATGHLVGGTLRSTPTTINFPALRTRCAHALNPDALYSSFDERGLGYGPYFQSIREIYTGPQSVLARLSNQLSTEDALFTTYQCHPTLLDGAFQSLIALADADGSAPMVPIEVGEFTLYQTVPHEFWCYGELLEKTATGIRCRLQLLTDEGVLIAELDQLVCTEIAGDTTANDEKTLDDCFYQYQWTADDNAHRDAQLTREQDNWLILVDESNAQVQNSLMQFIDLCKAHAITPNIINLAQLTGEADDQYLMLIKIAIEQTLIPAQHQLIYFADGLQNKDAVVTPAQLPDLAAVMKPCLPLIAVAQSLETPTNNTLLSIKNDPEFHITFTLVTRGAQMIDNESGNCALPAVAALTHLLANELQPLSQRHIDLPLTTKSSAVFEWQWLLDELIHGNAEDVALRAEQRLIKKWVAQRLDSGAQTIAHHLPANALEQAVYIAQGTGETPALSFQPWSATQTADDELYIQVEQLLVNKTSVNALAQGRKLPDNHYQFALARVIATGADCHGFTAGDAVLTLFDTAQVASQHWVKQYQCAKRSTNIAPQLQIDYANYAAAFYLLEDIANLEGKVLFIQNADSPLGLALINIARTKGIKIYATANSPSKRSYLQTLGCAQVFDNRDLTYITRIQQLTNNPLMDIVINDLGDEHSLQLFKLLTTNGHFIQLSVATGQTIQIPTQHNVRRNYRYAFVDIYSALMHQPGLFTALIARVDQWFGSNEQKPLLKGTVNAAEANNLLNYFMLGDSTEQALIEFNHYPVEILQLDSAAALNRNGTYLITGGTSGLGLQIGKWLLTQGVESIALVSRNGASREEAQQLAQQAQLAGKNLRLIDADISDSQAVQTLVQTINTEMLPLTGIIHCAMVLDDDFTYRMTPTRMQKVMEPKVKGALHLHQATLNLPLKQFICISSISSIIGNVGQTNYVAANAFLDGFAYYRRSLGLPATTINLGVLQEIGVVARDVNLANLLDAKGIRSLTTQEVLQGLAYILNNDPVQIGFFRVDWSTWAADSPKSAASTRFVDLVQKAKANQDMPQALVDLFKQLEAQEHYFARLMEIVSAELAQIVKVPVSDIKLDRSISDLGIDSLMSVELSRSLRAKYGLEVTSMELLSGPSLDQLTESLVTQLTDKMC